MSGGHAALWCDLLAESPRLTHFSPANGLPALPGAEVLDAHVTLRPFKSEAQWHAPVLTEEEEQRLRSSLVRPLPGRADRPAPTARPLSPTDRRIAEELIRNARVSLTDLAGTVGFSVATAGRRVTSLLERQALRLRVLVEPALLGRPVEARLRLRVPPSALEPVGAALAGCSDVRSCAAVTGSYNLLVDVCLEREADLYGFLTDVLGAHPAIGDVETQFVTRVYKRGPAVAAAAPTAAPRP
ncbi:Lrp/AsnC family transcriptional regulator [Streptomyces marincola]|uniref:Lrp/AsnC family transcriptional regulator n=1 Tax=Streptomyces marincola TaxID=2878388 RepID=UPI001CF1E064|nr:Lrp/AsnC family transcriptional regulator [Streptomyces marincola]UCM91925.1 Lrp/AsnC family transcriptional regulator [Streptomyces marincola]